jgi:ABC-type nickel/cobalt efflux system permease component RcnA
MLLLGALAASGHDIPNARVDRSIQVTLLPGRLEVDYEVSLSELTLVQDLRSLVGPVPTADRMGLFTRYGEETGPLNAKGFLVWVEGEEVPVQADGFGLAVEEHPRFTFHFRARVPNRGRLKIRDANFAGSEGTSRLAVRGREGVVIEGDALPGEVSQVPLKPVWQMTVSEERRTKGADLSFRPGAASRPPSQAISTAPSEQRDLKAHALYKTETSDNRLAHLLDRAARLPLFVLCALAFGLGVAHAIQPGHGKTLVSAVALGEQGGALKSALLAAVTTLAHISGVLAVAIVLWVSRTSRYGELNTLLARAAGFLIAAIGLWRLGRHLAGYGEHEQGAPVSIGQRGIMGLGIAGGMVPCWDAVILIVVAEAIGRLALGLTLLLAFSLGMAGVLVVVGQIAARFRGSLLADPSARWEKGLGIASGLALAAVGLYILAGA